MTDMDAAPCREHEGKPFIELQALLEEDELALTPDAWFEDAGAGQMTPEGKRRRRAVQACHLDCPTVVRLACLIEGLKPENREYGIFAGYLPAERREIAQKAAERDVNIRANILKMIESTQSKRPASEGDGPRTQEDA